MTGTPPATTTPEKGNFVHVQQGQPLYYNPPPPQSGPATWNGPWPPLAKPRKTYTSESVSFDAFFGLPVLHDNDLPIHPSDNAADHPDIPRAEPDCPTRAAAPPTCGALLHRPRPL